MTEVAMFLPLFLEITNVLLGCEETEDGEQMGFLAKSRQVWLSAEELANALAYGADNTSIN